MKTKEIGDRLLLQDYLRLLGKIKTARDRITEVEKSAVCTCSVFSQQNEDGSCGCGSEYGVNAAKAEFWSLIKSL